MAREGQGYPCYQRDMMISSVERYETGNHIIIIIVKEILESYMIGWEKGFTGNCARL